MTLVEQVEAVLRVGPDRWRVFVGMIEPEVLARAPKPGEWSAVNVLQHLIDVEPVFIGRVEAIRAGEDFPAFDQDRGGEVGRSVEDVQALIDRWATLRERGLEVLEAVETDDLARTAKHAELGEVTLENLLNEWAGHDLMHMVQAEEAVMQPFIVGVGPWRHFFAAHDADL